MYLAGFSLDNLSLMALTISTGFVVDDAIVMIENIVRYIEAGDPPMEAALKGAKQIGFTVVSLSVSLVAVFIPLLFMTGIVGRLFREFAITHERGGRRIGARFTDAHADDVREAIALRNEEEENTGRVLSPDRRISGRGSAISTNAGCTGCCRISASFSIVAIVDARRDDSRSTSSCRKDCCRSRIRE